MNLGASKCGWATACSSSIGDYRTVLVLLFSALPGFIHLPLVVEIK